MFNPIAHYFQSLHISINNIRKNFTEVTCISWSLNQYPFALRVFNSCACVYLSVFHSPVRSHAQNHNLDGLSHDSHWHICHDTLHYQPERKEKKNSFQHEITNYISCIKQWFRTKYSHLKWKSEDKTHTYKYVHKYRWALRLFLHNWPIKPTL